MIMIQDTTISPTFLLQLDHLIGKSSEYKGDDSPISTDGNFTRNYSSETTKLSRVSFWTKEKVGSYSKAAVAIQIGDFIKSDAFHTNWQLLPVAEQNQKIRQLEASISTFSTKVKSRLLDLQIERSNYKELPFYIRIFTSKPSKAKINSYKKAEESLQSALETIQAFGACTRLKVIATKCVGRKLYKGGIHLPRLLNEDLSFKKHPNFITFCSEYESSTTPFVAMMRDMESEGLVGRFNAMGIRTMLIDLHPKEDLALGALDPKAIQTFNKMCLRFIEKEFGREARKSIEHAEGYAPYKSGEKVIRGQLFDHFIRQLTPVEEPQKEEVVQEVVEELVLPAEAPPPKKGMLSKLRELTIPVPEFIAKRRKKKEEDSPQSVTAVEKSPSFFKFELFA